MELLGLWVRASIHNNCGVVMRVCRRFNRGDRREMQRG
jgi:hypothetical protein